MIKIIAPTHPTKWLIIQVDGMIDFHCLGKETGLICSRKMPNYPIQLGGTWTGPQKYFAKFGFFWAANPPNQ